jgi:hypothetical protein
VSLVATTQPNSSPQPGQPRITLKPDERWFYVGRTGSGKTHLARANLRVMERARWRICIIEPDGMWCGKTGRGAKDGPGTVDLPRLVNRFNPKLQVQWYVPSPPEYISDDPQLKQFLRDVMSEGSTVVYFDELTQLVDHGHQDPDFMVLWSQGRKHDIAAWASTQEPTRIPSKVMSQADNWAAFRVQMAEHAKVIAERTASPFLMPETPGLARRRAYRGEPQDNTSLTKLPLRWWYYFHAGGDYIMDHAQLMAPIPKDGWAGYEKGGDK